MLKAIQPVTDLHGDGPNVAILIFFYILQGIPLGLAAAVPLILTKMGNISYKEQAQFSFAFWPFSLKLLWAPIVDACFVARVGRRKSWLVPVQYAIGLLMLFLSYNVDSYLGSQTQSVDIVLLTGLFFMLNFLAATQDIAVDGWALTMLKPANVAWASTCNSIGQTGGYFLGYAFFIGLDAWNLVTMRSYLMFWGVLFIVATTLVAIFKSENSDQDGSHSTADESSKEDELTVYESYVMLWRIVRLPNMATVVVFLMTAKIMFAPTDAVSSLKLIERGVSKDILALMSIPLMPLQMALAYFLSKHTSGAEPLRLWQKSVVPRLICGLVISYLVYISTSFFHVAADGTTSFSAIFYAIILVVVCIQQIFATAMFVAIMAFFARISDPAIGGTYMTLLNTVTNLGGNWPATVSLWFVDNVTVKRCSIDSTTWDTTCGSGAAVKSCESAGGQCHTTVDGFYVESAACFVWGLLWLSLWGRRAIASMQSVPLQAWRVVAGRANFGKKS